MARPSKIDPEKMRKLLRQGRSQRQIAKEFNVSDSAISQRMKNLNLDVAKCAQLESASVILSDCLDTVGQLFKINQDALYLLDLLMASIRGEDWALSLLRKNQKLHKKLKYQDPIILALQTMREIRGQLKLQNEILNSLANFTAVADFQKQILDIVGEMGIEMRKKFVDRLKEEKAIRSAVRF